MAVIVFDDFNRPDDPTSLGTATTGQVWIPYDDVWTPGDTNWQILSNQAAREVGNPGQTAGYALVDTGIYNCVVQVTIGNAAFGGNLNNSNFGVVFRWTDSLNYWIGTWSRAGQFLRLCQVSGGVTSCTNEGFPGPVQIQDEDTLRVVCCGDTVQGYHNEDLTVTHTTNPGQGGTGTFCGLQCGGGVIFDPAFALFDDFSVETNLDCEGASWSIPPLLWSATGTVESPPVPSVNTMTFDGGVGSEYYLVAQITDSGDDLRSKVVKSVRATGKLTNASIQVYGYDVSSNIVTEDLETGTNATASVPLPDSTGVAQSPIMNVNVPNSVLHTIRIAGDDRGEDERDRIDEIASQVSQQGVRR